MTHNHPPTTTSNSQGLLKTGLAIGKRHALRSGLVVAFVVLVWTGLGAIVPYAIKPKAEQLASQALGRTVSIGQLQLNPWQLTIGIDHLTVAPAATAATTPQLQINHIGINASWSSMWHLVPVIEQVVIDQPQLHMSRQTNGVLDVQDIITLLQSKPSSPNPARMAIYNIQVNGGRVDLDDLAKARQHQLKNLNLRVPFIDTLGKDTRKVHISPHLSFELNGTRFETQASTQPFDPSLATKAQIDITELDIAPYLAYLPADLAYRPHQAKLSTHLDLAFEQSPKPSLTVTGKVGIKGLEVVDNQGAQLLTLAQATLQLNSVKPFANDIALGKLELISPQINAVRLANGSINWMPSTAQTASPRQAPKPAAAQPSSASPWRVSLAQLSIEEGKVHWTDRQQLATNGRPTELGIEHLGLQAQNLAQPPTESAPFEASWTLNQPQSPGLPPPTNASFAVKGQWTGQSAQMQANVSQLSLASFSGYAKPYFSPTIGGMLNAQATINWQDSTHPLMRVQVPELTLSQFNIKPAQGEAASFQKLRVQNALWQQTATTSPPTLHLGDMTLTEPRIALQRDHQGQWMFQAWQPKALETSTNAAKPANPHSQPSISTGALRVEKGRIQWLDAVPDADNPVVINLYDLNLKLSQFKLSQAHASQLDLSVRTQLGNEPASLMRQLKSQVQLQWPKPTPNDTMPTPTVQATINLQRWPMQTLVPYVAQQLNMHISQSDASFQGQVKWMPQTGHTQAQGNLTLEDFQAQTLTENDDLLRCKTLNLKGIFLDQQANQPLDFRIENGSLNDFFARIVVLPNGQLNLQHLIKPDPQAASTSAPIVPTAAARIQIGPMSLVQGRIEFSDRFIQPNYQASLSQLTGRIGNFSSFDAQAADLELKGKAQGSADLNITGQINPLAKPLQLNIQGKVKELELSPLTPYAIKYTGHGVERGKLSMNVNYAINPQGELKASNQLILNQLSFGPAVEGAPASLPVRLAVALLADRHGIIDLDLPISGSINDPEFKLAPLVFKVLGNIIVKAVTSPFSLLSGAFQGGGNGINGGLHFDLGRTTLTRDSIEQVQRIAQSLSQKPQLNVTIQGSANLETERQAWRQHRLQTLLEALAGRQTGTASAADSHDWSTDDRQKWLTLLYQKTDLPKPKNAVGMVKSISAIDMETLLLANIECTDQTMRDLANERAQTIKEQMVQLKVLPQQVFIGTPKTKWSTAEETAKGVATELTLAAP